MRADLLAWGRERYRELGFPVVKRHRAAPKVVGDIGALVRETDKIFGRKHLDRTLANVASVALALDPPVSAKMVRRIIDTSIYDL